MLLSILLQAMPSMSTLITIVTYAGIAFVFYFFMIRPQQKKQKDQRSFIENLKKGDAVVTIGGLHGRVVSVDAATVTLDVDRGVKMTFEKTSISREATVKMPETEKK